MANSLPNFPQVPFVDQRGPLGISEAWYQWLLNPSFATLNMTPTGVVAGTYGNASNISSFIVNSSGLLTFANNVPISINANQITSGTLSAARFPALSGDVSNSAGSLTTTLATVNASIGSFGSASQVSTFTVNGKGLITAASNVAIAIDASQITSGTLAATQFPALTGDITTTAGALATTLKNTGTAGTYVKTTFDAQGRETSGSTQLNLTTDVTGILPVANGGTGNNNGLPAIRASGRSVAQNGANASVSTFTVGGSDGSFELSANVNVTVATLCSFTVTTTYTDETNAVRVLTMGFTQLTGATLLSTITQVTGTGPYEGILYHLRCKAGTAITIATTGTFTTVTYNVEGVIKQTA